MAKKDNTQFVSYFGSFGEEESGKRAGKGAKAKSSGGRHSRGNLAKLPGPPEANRSIATGTLKTKSRLAAEADEAARLAAEEQAWDGGYDGAYDAGYEPGFDGGYGYDAGYDTGYGYDGAYDAGYDTSYDASYNPAYTGGYDDGYGYGYDGYGYGDDGAAYGPEGSWDGDWATQPEQDQWLGTAITGSNKKRGIFGRRKDKVQPSPYRTMTQEDKYDAEAAARARANAAVDAYESGVPLGLALGGMGGYQDFDASGEEGFEGIEAQPGSGMGSGGKAVPTPSFGANPGGKGRGKGAAVPSMAGMGVQVQVPTSSMEKSLNLTTSAGHQRRLEAGTGSKSSAMRSGVAALGRGAAAAAAGVAGGMKHNTYGADKELGKILRRRILTILIILAVVLVAAAIGAVIGYFVSLSNRLGLDDIDEVKAALTEPEENQPYYVLFAADLNDMDGSNDDLDAMLLARIDEQNRKVTVLAIPGNIEVILSDFDYHPATEARADGGNARLITALSNLLEIKIAHYVMTDAHGLATIVDAIGGVELTLEQELDDPQAGWEYFKAGTYTMTGEQALTVLRADNYHEGENTRGENRCAFGKQLMEKILGSGWLSFANITDVIAGNVSTDYSASQILKLARTMSGITAEDVLSGVAPGDQTTTVEGVRVFSPSYTQLSKVMELMEAGVAPVLEDRQGANVNPADVTVTVWNGSGVVGGAAMLADILTDAGFVVEEVTNAQAYVYTETLIIYDYNSTAEEAYAVQNALGQGRVLDGTWKYTFTTDILVVLGSEWK